MFEDKTKVVIIGASFSGLAVAACLRRAGVAYSIIEKAGVVGAAWRHQYDRLHLHTNKRSSGLPFLPWKTEAPRYPSRSEVVGYLEAYQRELDITPRFDTEAVSVARDADGWVIETRRGVIRSSFVVMATGAFGRPKGVMLPGQESFPGRLLHSFEYKTGAAFAGKRVLVVGFGNSGCEIAIDLAEQGAEVSMAVRSPVNVIPRDIAGVPILELSLLLRWLPPRAADAVARPLVRATVGDIRVLGLDRMSYGPIEQIVKDGKAPVLDIGVIRMIRDGKIGVFPGVERIEGPVVRFADGRSGEFHAIVAAIGYERNYEEIVKVGRERFEDLRFPVGKQRFFGKEGLYFCGYWISPTGQIREIARDARKIAGDIGKKNDGL